MLDHEPVRGAGRPGRRHALYPGDVAEAQGAQVRDVEATDGAGRIDQGVGSLVPEGRSIRRVAGPDAVQHDDDRPAYLCLLSC